MTDVIVPGQKGEPLLAGVIVVRLAKPSFIADETLQAHPLHFELSSADKASELQSLSVWAKELTPPEIARNLMGEKRAEYGLALYLNVDDVRDINLQPDAPEPPLDVVWDPIDVPQAEGHAGIIGLVRPPKAPKSTYKALRAKLAHISTVEQLPDY